MRVVGLVSGGKDSCYNLLQCVAAGHEVVCLAHLVPADTSSQEEDSQMYQTVGWDSVNKVAEALGLPLYVETVRGSSLSTERDYQPTESDEVEDLYRLLARLKEEAAVTAVSVGAILSDYQRVRVENVCGRLGLTVLAFLWQRDQAELLAEMVSVGLEAVLVKVACLGLGRKHLGASLAQMESELTTLSRKFGVNVCGEGGEYETFTLDSPLFRKRLSITSSQIIAHSDDAFAPVFLMSPQCQATDKPHISLTSSQEDLLRQVKVGEQSLLEALSPRSYASPHCDLENVENLPDLPLETLDLSEAKEGYEALEDGWFNVTSFGKHEDNRECVKEAFETLLSVLAREGASLEKIVKVLMYVDSMENYAEMNSQYVTYFGLNPPVRVCVAPERLGEGRRLCLVGRGQTQCRDRRVLHVQSVSHWAPANIGPYSQGVRTGSSLLTAGSIGLLPGSMQLATTEAAQAALALRHLARVVSVMAGRGLEAARSATCYVTSQEAARQADRVWRQEREEREEGNQGNQALAVRMVRVAQLPRYAKVEWELEFSVDQL